MLNSERLQPGASNPFATHPSIFTVVTPDMAASLNFYTKVMGNEEVEKGELDGPLPTVEGVGTTGRRYALLRHREPGIVDRGCIRLLEAPADAIANRPRPSTRFMDEGLAVIECHTSDFSESHRFLTDNGVQTVSDPQYYFWGDPDAPFHSTTSYSAFGPAGEQFLISCQNIPGMYKVRRPVTFPGLIGPITSHSVMAHERWGIRAFYEAVFGLTNVLDRVIKSKPINLLCGVPEETYTLHSVQGSGTRMEIWEFYQYGPPAEVPPFPTQLDRTGLAMVTHLVDDLAAVRARTIASGIPILGEGALPTPGQKTRDGFYIRGVVGELIEIVGRP